MDYGSHNFAFCHRRSTRTIVKGSMEGNGKTCSFIARAYERLRNLLYDLDAQQTFEGNSGSFRRSPTIITASFLIGRDHFEPADYFPSA